MPLLRSRVVRPSSVVTFVASAAAGSAGAPAANRPSTRCRLSGAPHERNRFDGLTGLVVESMGRALAAGDVYLSVGKDRRRAKAPCWDGTGVCVYAKRLAKGRFASPWERASGGQLVLSMTELAAFFEGSEIALRVRMSPSEPRPERDRLRFG